jgi:MFS family permease
VHGIENSFHVGREVAILSISLYVMGLGVGPLFAGPISELYGRNIVYRTSFALFFVFSFPVAFAPDIGTSDAGSPFPPVVHLIDPDICLRRGLPNLPFCYRVLRRGFSQRCGGKRQRYVPQRDGRNVCIFQHFDPSQYRN